MKVVRLTKTFVTWFIFFNWPGLLMSVLLLWPALPQTVPPLGLLVLIPALFWVNIPERLLGLADLVGHSHFGLSDFGFMPKTIFAWLSVFLCWTVLAAAMTGFTELMRWIFGRGEVLELTPDRSERDLNTLRESLRDN